MGSTFVGVPVTLGLKSVAIRQWCPTPDGSGKPEQVHLVIELEGPLPALVIRFKSKKGPSAFVEDLVSNAHEVWPEEEVLHG